MCELKEWQFHYSHQNSSWISKSQLMIAWKIGIAGSSICWDSTHPWIILSITHGTNDRTGPISPGSLGNYIFVSLLIVSVYICMCTIVYMCRYTCVYRTQGSSIGTIIQELSTLYFWDSVSYWPRTSKEIRLSW